MCGHVSEPLLRKSKRPNAAAWNFSSRRNSRAKALAGYGAPAKGNTLLNYLGVRTDFLDYTVDRSPHKQGHFLPGTHIPILHPDVITTTKPDYLVILPWNIQDRDSAADGSHPRVGWAVRDPHS